MSLKYDPQLGYWLLRMGAYEVLCVSVKAAHKIGGML